MAKLKLTAARKRDWLATRGNRCPYCKSPDLEAGDHDFDGDSCTQDVRCLVCRRTWTEVYTLSDLLDEDGNEAARPPESNTITNRQRRTWALVALQAFVDACGDKDDLDVGEDGFAGSNLEGTIVNLIADLMHVADHASNHDDDKAVELVRIAGDRFIEERGAP